VCVLQSALIGFRQIPKNRVANAFSNSYLLTATPTMYNVSTPLAPRSGDSRRGPELTPYGRGKIIGAVESGKSPGQIAASQKLSRSTLYHTIYADPERDEGRSKPRSGRPKLYTDRDERRILCQAQLYPKCTYANVRRACAITLCDSTLKTILGKHSISNWRAKQRPELTEEVAAKRLA
jgi:transposase